MGPLERLVGSLRRRFQTFPDKRHGTNVRYEMADIGASAFSVFFMGSPSFLAHQRRLEEGHGRSNCETLFGLSGIPSDNHIRAMLDPADPSLLEPVYGDVLRELEQVGGLSPFQRLADQHVLIALDGTEYFCSQNIHCPQCSKRARAGGKTEYFHAMLGATLVAPGHQKVVPLPPEFIAPQDGAEKQDCENRAAHRWLLSHAVSYAHLNPVYLGDDLFSRQPLCAAVLAQNAHFIFVCKPTSHPLICEYIAGAELESWKEGELEELAPIEVTLPAEGRREGDVVPVHLEAKVTEVGTLLLEAVPTQPQKADERWKIELSVRAE